MFKWGGIYDCVQSLKMNIFKLQYDMAKESEVSITLLQNIENILHSLFKFSWCSRLPLNVICGFYNAIQN